MAWAFGATGAMAHSNNSDTVPLDVDYPSGISAGHILLLAVRSNSATAVITPSDVTTLVHQRTTNGTVQLLAKIATGAESGTFQISTDVSNSICAQCARFTGGPSTLTGIAHATGNAGGSAAAGLPFGGLTITQDECLVLLIGGKQCNASSFDVPAGMDAEIGEGVQGTVTCMVWDYKVQTTAADWTAGSWTIGAGDASNARSSISVALLAGATSGNAPRARFYDMLRAA